MNTRIRFILVLLLAFPGFFMPATGQTPIPGGDVFGTWDSTGSPYNINGEIIVPVDSVLYIESNVEIVFKGYFKFVIYGQLVVSGAEDDSVFFTTNDSLARWWGLKFLSSNKETKDGISELNYCHIEYAKENNFGGGGVHSEDPVIIRNCLITKCQGHDGGGVGGNGSAFIENSVIKNNKAWDGGGIGLGFVNIKDSEILNNQSHIGGGGISSISYGCLISLQNVLIKGNKSGLAGGVAVSHSTIYCYNTTIRDNHGNYAGGLYIFASDVVFPDTARTNIFMNYSPQVQDLVVKDCNEEIVIHIDTFTVEQPDSYLYKDISNNQVGLLINQGLIPQTSQNVYVSPYGSNSNSGFSPDSALLNIDYALRRIKTQASDPGTIFLAPGTYSKSITGEHMPIYTKNHVSIEGDSINPSIIDGENKYLCIYHWGRTGHKLNNLTITNGSGELGGGVYNLESYSVITNCFFENNEAFALSFQDCGNINLSLLEFRNNLSVALNINGNSTIKIDRCTFSNNIIAVQSSDSIILTNSLFYENKKSLILDWCSAAIYNCTFYNNYSIEEGSVVSAINSNMEMYNTIVWDDTTKDYNRITGVSYYGGPYIITIDYSAIRDGINSVLINGTIFLLYWLEHNIGDYPKFLNPSGGNFYLHHSSPCIDKGTHDITGLPIPSLDLRGSPRVINDRIDMGCYEFTYGLAIPDINDKWREYFVLSPNPSLSYLNVHFNKAGHQLTFLIYDLYGRKIEEVEVASDKIRIDISFYSKGLYLAVLRDDLRVIDQQKFLVTK